MDRPSPERARKLSFGLVAPALASSNELLALN